MGCLFLHSLFYSPTVLASNRKRHPNLPEINRRRLSIPAFGAFASKGGIQVNLAHLYYFCKLAELQHYTRAAQELYITQPSLSGAISSLEGELGISLFEKRGRNVYLTKYGREFYEYVSSALHTLDKGVALAKEHGNALTGTIDIGCIPTIQSDFLPQVLLAFRGTTGGHVEFNLYEAQTNKVIQAVQQGEWDVGFCSYVPDMDDLFFVPVLQQPLVAAVHRSHPLAQRQSLYFSDLADHQLISYHLEQPIGRSVQHLLADHHLAANQRFSGETSMCGLCRLGSYVAILLQTSQLQAFDDIVLIPLPEVPAEFRIVHMVFNQKRYKAPVVESFIDYVTGFWSYRQ